MQHQGEQTVLHSKYTVIKMHQHFQQTASGQNLVSGLTCTIRNPNQTDHTKATGSQCRFSALANVCV